MLSRRDQTLWNMAGLLEEPACSNIREKIEAKNMAKQTTARVSVDLIGSNPVRVKVNVTDQDIESAIQTNRLVFGVAEMLARPVDKGMDLGHLALSVGKVDYYLSIIRVIRRVIRRQSGELANAAEVHSAGMGLFEQYRDLVGDAEAFLRVRRGDLCKRIVKLGGEAP